MKPLIRILLVVGLMSCEESKPRNESMGSEDLTVGQIDSASSDSTLDDDSLAVIDSSSQVMIPVLGDRMTVSGDFDGDGKQEELVEHYISQLSQKETNKAYENDIEYSEFVGLIIKKKPQSFFTSDNKEIDTLHISSNPHLFGILFLKNEGDLNNDGKDELSYVIDWADWSNLNTYHIVSFINQKWTEVYSFSIWEWQFNELNYGEGLIKKLSDSRIECYYMNEEAILDTAIIQLNKNN